MLIYSGVACVLLAALGWAAVLSTGGSLDPVPALLAGAGIILASTVATVGLLVTSSRWSRRLALSSLAAGPIVARSEPIEGLWLVSAVLTVVAAVALFNRSLPLRKLPAASGPPARALLTPLVLLGAPVAYGATGNGSPSWALIAGSVSGLVVAFGYARVLPGGLMSIRLWPAFAAGIALAMEPAAAAASVVMAAVVAVLAWSRDTRTAFHPPSEKATSFSIPPELSPREVLDAANIDDHGRPR